MYRRKILKSITILIALAIATLFFVVKGIDTSIATENINTVLSTENNVANEKNINYEAVMYFTNQERLRAGLQPLEFNRELSQSAQKKADDMANGGYFSHTGPNGENLEGYIDGFGYVYKMAGENLARGYEDPQELVEAWMQSPEHKKNILLSGYEDVGIGIASVSSEDSEVIYVVEHFGDPGFNLLSAISK